MNNQEQTGNGCAIAGLATLFVGIFLLGGIMGIASIILGALSMKGKQEQVNALIDKCIRLSCEEQNKKYPPFVGGVFYSLPILF